MVNIYVGNLPLETTEEELRQEFLGFGEVISVTLMNDAYQGGGKPYGYGYVEMASKVEGAAAVAGLQGKRLGERVITVIEALPLSSRESALPETRGRNRYNRKRESKWQAA